MMKEQRAAPACAGGNRRGRREFMVMLALGAPGLGLFFWGFKLLSVSRGVTPAAVALIAAGAALLLSSAVYHYSCDFKGRYSSRAKSIAGYVFVVVLGGVAGVLIKNLLFKH